VLDEGLVAVVAIDAVVTTEVRLEAVCFDPPEWQATTRTLEATSAANRRDLIGGMRTVRFLSQADCSVTSILLYLPGSIRDHSSERSSPTIRGGMDDTSPGGDGPAELPPTLPQPIAATRATAVPTPAPTATIASVPSTRHHRYGLAVGLVGGVVLLVGGLNLLIALDHTRQGAAAPPPSTLEPVITDPSTTAAPAPVTVLPSTTTSIPTGDEPVLFDAGPSIALEQVPADCRDGTVIAMVSGEVPVTSALLHWQGDHPGSAAMTANGSSWSGTLGPFTEMRKVRWWITATDASGATGTSGRRSLTCRR
jgi:hypothetical protein